MTRLTMVDYLTLSMAGALTITCIMSQVEFMKHHPPRRVATDTLCICPKTKGEKP